MSIPGLERLRHKARGLWDWYNDRKVAILMYHRVVDLPADPPLLTVTPRHFAEHLEVLRRQACCLSLSDLAQRLRWGRLPRRAVVITFDDGYADNLLVAKPALEAQDIPATVFVATGLLGLDREYWWDEVERLLLLPGQVPQKLQLCVAGDTFEAEVGASAEYSSAAYEAHRQWNVLREDCPTRRHEVYRALHRWIRPRPAAQRQQALADLQHWAGASASGRPSHRVMTPAELVKLAEGGLVDVGAHTVTHPMLSAQPVHEQRTELHESKARLEEILGRSVTTFAYPYGSETDYSQDTVAAVRAAGFRCACSTKYEVVRRGADGYRLPRLMVLDWNGDEFAGYLNAWFHS